MALTRVEIARLADEHAAGAAFDAVLTIGRQNLVLRDRDITALTKRIGRDLGGVARPSGRYADDLLREVFGARSVEALDASDYEGATVIHDLNKPVPISLHQRYDVVIDGGSLEHVFDVATALANVMRVTKVGGLVVLSNPANNLCGHGFFQFSPELMFRVFTEAHGFAVNRVTLVDARFPGIELARLGPCWDVTDPDALQDRVIRVSRRPVMLLVSATKLRHLDDPFERAPQQSDYAARWDQRRAHARGGRKRFNWLPDPVRAGLVGYRQLARASARLNQRAYRRAD